MKINTLILAAICSVFSCQNKNADNQITWLQKIDNSIAVFEKTKTIDKTRIDKDSTGYGKTTVYKEDKTGLSKMEAELSYGELMNFKRVFYIRDKQIIKPEIFGFTKYIQKGKKMETSPCCEHFKEIIYFKSPLEGLKFKKALPVLEFEDNQRRFNEFEQLNLKKEILDNPENEYNKILEVIENLKEVSETNNQ